MFEEELSYFEENAPYVSLSEVVKEAKQEINELLSFAKLQSMSDNQIMEEIERIIDDSTIAIEDPSDAQFVRNTLWGYEK